MKNIMEKLTPLLIAVSLVLTMSGCSGSIKVKENDVRETEKAELEISGPDISKAQRAKYEFVRVDNSPTDEDGVVLVDWYFDKLVIKTPGKAADKINADMDELCDEFFSDDMREAISEAAKDYDYEYGNRHLYTVTAEVSYNKNGIICASYHSEFFLGATFTGSYWGIVYDLDTGDRLGLAELLGVSESEALALVKSVYWDAIVEHYTPEMMFENAEETFEMKTLPEYKFYLDESGEIYLVADKYEFAAGAAGEYDFASGLYINK